MRRDAGWVFVWLGNTSRFQADFPRMEGTNHCAAGNNSFPQRAALVRTTPIDGQHAIAKIENGNLTAGDVHRSPLPQRDILHRRDTNPLFIVHAGTFSSSSI